LSNEVDGGVAGLRAATEHSDYSSTSTRSAAYLWAGGIRSTG